MPTTNTKFWTYHQNNSGGSFDHYSKQGIGCCVAIEATDYQQANDRAENIGIYFNGCNDGRDCDCCGDRWYPAYADEGTEEPEEYGKPLAGGWGISSYVHYLDGKIEAREEIVE